MSTKCISLLLILLITPLTASMAQSAPGLAAALRPAPSAVEIPVRISLEPLFRAAEQDMPRQAGNWRSWKDSHGVKTKYRAWRGPLLFRMQGDVLQVQAHVRYWVRAEKQVLGTLDLKSSCGVKEAPRQAVIGAWIRIGWRPDWTLRPEFRVMPTRFIDACEMTIASIDVTPLIEKVFQRQLRDKLHAAMLALAPRMNVIRQQAEKSWALLQEPIQIGDGHWLSLRPSGIALAPLAGHAGSLDTHLAIMMIPELHTHTPPIAQQSPLPPLGRFYPSTPGLNLLLAIGLDFAQLNRAVSARIENESFDLAGHRIGADKIAISGRGQAITVDAQLTGDAAGRVTISANVVYAPENRQLRLEELKYSYAPEDPFLEPQAALLYGYLRRVLESTVNDQLEQQLKQWQQRLAQALERITPEGVKLDMSSLQLDTVTLNIEQDRVRINGRASGRARLEFR
jgi:hypothetical protein